MYDIGKVVAARKKRNLTQEGLSIATRKAFPPGGVSLSAIRQIECGMKSGLHSIPKIAVTLGVELRTFLKKRKTA